MATPRKHWFKVADSVLHEDYPDDVLATLVRLSAYLNTRWAREGRTPAEAVEAVLTPAAAMQVTRRERLASARSTLRRLSLHVTVTVSEQGRNTSVRWPKWAEFQGLTTRELPDSRPAAAPSETQTKTQTKNRKTPRRIRTPQPVPTPPAPAPVGAVLAGPPAAADAAPEGTPRRRRTQLMPTRLCDDDAQRLLRLTRPLGMSEDQLRYAARRVRDWSHANGRTRSDWVLTILNAIRDGWALRGYKPPAGGGQPPPSSPGWDLERPA